MSLRWSQIRLCLSCVSEFSERLLTLNVQYATTVPRYSNAATAKIISKDKHVRAVARLTTLFRMRFGGKK